MLFHKRKIQAIRGASNQLLVMGLIRLRYFLQCFGLQCFGNYYIILLGQINLKAGLNFAFLDPLSLR